jgi:hypothetical protein
MSQLIDTLAGAYSAYSGGAGGGMEGDQTDAQHMDQFAPSSQEPWWQGVIKYGLTRAIDNQFHQPATQGSGTPGSFAGQNGRTYNSDGSPVFAGQPLKTWLLLLGVGALALLLLKKL